jgi:Phospholipid-translocating ATPase N-terminal
MLPGSTWAFTKGSERPPAGGCRKIYANCPAVASTYTFPSNEVVTSKYTPFNFLFLNLYEQFHRIANMFPKLTRDVIKINVSLLDCRYYTNFSSLCYWHSGVAWFDSTLGDIVFNSHKRWVDLVNQGMKIMFGTRLMRN